MFGDRGASGVLGLCDGDLYVRFGRRQGLAYDLGLPPYHGRDGLNRP